MLQNHLQGGFHSTAGSRLDQSLECFGAKQNGQQLQKVLHAAHTSASKVEIHVSVALESSKTLSFSCSQYQPDEPCGRAILNTEDLCSSLPAVHCSSGKEQLGHKDKPGFLRAVVAVCASTHCLDKSNTGSHQMQLISALHEVT